MSDLIKGIRQHVAQTSYRPVTDDLLTEAADELEQMRAELDKTTKWCAALVWAADQVDEPTIAEIRAYVDRLVMTRNTDLCPDCNGTLQPHESGCPKREPQSEKNAIGTDETGTPTEFVNTECPHLQMDKKGHCFTCGADVLCLPETEKGSG